MPGALDDDGVALALQGGEGGENAPGTPDVAANRPSSTLERLVECLAWLIDHNTDKETRPTLILNGDSLELALATTNKAAMAFMRFMELLESSGPGGKPLFQEIIYIPGNHDHHLWETAREQQYIQFLGEEHKNSAAAGKPIDLKAPWHTTRMFDTPGDIVVRSPLLEKLHELHDIAIPVRVFYPNFGLRSENQERCVVFHHGQFIEPIYLAMSKLRTLVFSDPAAPPEDQLHEPTLPWDMEKENFAWIDFFWSALGRSGPVGKAVESIYRILDEPEQRRILASRLAQNLAIRYDTPGWGERMESLIAKILIKLAIAKASTLERKKDSPHGLEADEHLDPETRDRLKRYVGQSLSHQLERELDTTKLQQLTVIIGHTHKPFVAELRCGGGLPERVDVYNTGGWVVDEVNPRKEYGASVVLLDDHLDSCAIELYREPEGPGTYDNVAVKGPRVKTRIPYREGEASSPLALWIKGLLGKSDESPWHEFSTTASREVWHRASVLEKHLEKIAAA